MFLKDMVVTVNCYGMNLWCMKCILIKLLLKKQATLSHWFTLYPAGASGDSPVLSGESSTRPWALSCGGRGDGPGSSLAGKAVALFPGCGPPDSAEGPQGPGWGGWD